MASEQQDVRAIPIVPNIHPDDKPGNEYPTQSSQLDPSADAATAQAGAAEQTVAGEPEESNGFLSAAYDYKFVVILIIVILIIAIIAYVFYKHQNKDKSPHKKPKTLQKQPHGGGGGGGSSGMTTGQPPPPIETPPSKEELLAELAAQRKRQELRKREMQEAQGVQGVQETYKQESDSNGHVDAASTQAIPAEVCARREECMMYDVDVGGNDITAVVDTDNSSAHADDSLFSFNDISDNGGDKNNENNGSDDNMDNTDNMGNADNMDNTDNRVEPLGDDVYEGFDDEYVDPAESVVVGDNLDQESDRCSQILASGSRCKVRATTGDKCRRHAKLG